MSHTTQPPLSRSLILVSNAVVADCWVQWVELLSPQRLVKISSGVDGSGKTIDGVKAMMMVVKMETDD